MNRRNQIIEELKRIPDLPVAVTEALRIIQDPDYDPNKLEQVVSRDPGLTSNILKLANSVSFGGSFTIETLHQGIVRLGRKKVMQLVISSGIAPVSKQEIKGYGLPAGELLKHSAATASGTNHLASHLGIKNPEIAPTAGLLHDIGKIVMGTFLEIEASPIISLAQEKHYSFEQAERETLGIDHAEIGAFLLEQWNIPESIVHTVRWHHEPEQYEDTSLALDLVHLSNILVNMTGIGGDIAGLCHRPNMEVVERLQATEVVFQQAIADIAEELPELERAFDIPRPESQEGTE